MDWYTQRLLSEAIATDDAYRAKYAQPERQAEPQRELVYKTCERHPMQQQRIRDHTPEEAARWNDWLDRRVNDKLDRFAEIIGEESGALLKAETVKLREEIGQLKAELTVLQGIVRGEIATIKGKSDAA